MWISKLIAACTICVCPATIPVAEVVLPRAQGYDEATNLPRGDSQFSMTDLVIDENTELKAQNLRLLEMIEQLNAVIAALHLELVNEHERR